MCCHGKKGWIENKLNVQKVCIHINFHGQQIIHVPRPIGTNDQMSMFKKMTNIGQVESNKNYTQQVLVLSKI